MTKLQSATDTVKELICWYVLLLLGAAGVYSFAESTSLADALYWAATTATSTGYGDLSPKTLIGRIDAVILMHLSIFVIAPMVIVRLIDRLTVDSDAFTHSEQVKMQEDVTAIRGLLSVGLFDREPNTGYPTAEPSLRDIVFRYYRAHFEADAARAFTDLYFTKLTERA